MDVLDLGSLKEIQRNLNDGALEGFAHRNKPILAIQYHPEAASGYHDSQYFMFRFRDVVRYSTGEQSSAASGRAHMPTELIKVRQRLYAVHTQLKQGKSMLVVQSAHYSLILVLKASLMTSEKDEFAWMSGYAVNGLNQLRPRLV